MCLLQFGVFVVRVSVRIYWLQVVSTSNIPWSVLDHRRSRTFDRDHQRSRTSDLDHLKSETSDLDQVDNRRWSVLRTDPAASMLEVLVVYVWILERTVFHSERRVVLRRQWKQKMKRPCRLTHTTNTACTNTRRDLRNFFISVHFDTKCAAVSGFLLRDCRPTIKSMQLSV